MDKKIKSGKSKAQLAFYEPPTCVEKTSSEIISEARAAIMAGGTPSTPNPNPTSTIIQPVNTKRPYTPRERQRTLFGLSRGTGQRPPSSFSLRYLQYEDSGEGGEASSSSCVPPKRTTHLMPMPHSRNATLDMAKDKLLERNRNSLSDIGSIGDLENHVDISNSATNLWTRLPSISRIVDAQDMRRKRRHFRASASLDNLPEELEGAESASKIHPIETPVRNAYSSPKEHTERLSDCLNVSDLQIEGSASVHAMSKTSTITPRKIMKHDNLIVNVGHSNEVKVTKTSQGREDTVSKMLNRSSLSLDRKNLSDTTGATTSGNKLALEQNLFGPNVTLKEPNIPKCTEVDGGVFGEKLHEKSEAPEGFELDKEAAIFDNCINEAKLAYVYKRKCSEETLSITSKVQQIINKLTELAMIEGADAVVMHGLDELYDALVTYRKGDINSKLKTQVLKCVYRFVERSEDNLLLKLARIIFCLPVTGSNLAGVCKLVFKVARSDKNDCLFLQGNILDLFIDALGSASPLEDAEACVYGYGALKFLTMNNQLLNHVLDLGTLDLMVLHLKIVNSARSEGGRLPEQTSHAVFQLTGALRNIAGEETTFSMLVSNGAVSQLCQSMELFSTDLDLVTNIARTFSIISTNDECCNAIVIHKNCTKLFAKLFLKYPGRQDIVVRLGYALGNLLAKSDEIRLELLEADGAMDTLLDLLQLYLQKDLDLAGQESEPTPQRENILSLESGSDGSVEDVIIKIIRIIANMSMNLEVGERLTCLPNALMDEEEIIDSISSCKKHYNDKDRAIGDRTVGLLLTVLRRKSVAESAELVLSTLSTLNNLTFYPTVTEHSIFHSHLMDLSQALYTLLMSNLDECLVETTKVLGNLSRSKPARDFLLETGGLNQLLKFLQTDNHELLRTTTGVLVNLMADADKREALHHSNGVTRLIALLLYHGESDWQLASLICQVLWNFCIDMTNLTWLGTDHTTQLVEILADFLGLEENTFCLPPPHPGSSLTPNQLIQIFNLLWLSTDADDERLFGARESVTVDESQANKNGNTFYQQWEEFAVIATNLLEKIETYMEGIHQSSLHQALPINQLNISPGTSSEKRFNHWEEIPPPSSPAPTTSY